MSDFLTKLVARNLGLAEGADTPAILQPRPSTHFDPIAPVLTPVTPLEDETPVQVAPSPPSAGAWPTPPLAFEPEPPWPQLPSPLPQRSVATAMQQSPLTQLVAAPAPPIAPVLASLPVPTLSPASRLSSLPGPAAPSTATVPMPPAPAQPLVERLLREIVVQSHERFSQGEPKPLLVPPPHPATQVLSPPMPLAPALPPTAPIPPAPVSSVPLAPESVMPPTLARVQPMLAPVSPMPTPPAARVEASATAAPPTIHITIGRIEVRATPPAVPAKPGRTSPSATSLADYLQGQKGGRR